MKYIPEREYSKKHMSKGKSKVGVSYRREERADRVPESRVQLLKFLKDQNRELKNFIEETGEEKMLLSGVFDEEDISDDEEENVREDIDVDDSDSDEELLESAEWEL